jgi:7-carboxy-7-deazaguanine synthase
MNICEIFAGIQGESSFAGLPCVFIRMSGCNLRCLYCDTSYSYEGGDEMTADEIIETVNRFGLGLVEITGGEPLLQADIKMLIARLLDLGYKALVETNGTLDISGIDQRVVVIMDVKTPGSGAQDSFLRENFDMLKKNDELKFVLTDRNDYDWAVRTIREYGLSGKCSILFSPAFGRLYPEELAAWIIGDRLNVRLNLQLQKYIYGPDVRGV